MPASPSRVPLLLLLAAAPAVAQPAGGFDVEHLKPAAGARDLVATPSPRVAGDLEVGAGLLLRYAKRPLVLATRRGDDVVRYGEPVVDDRVLADVYGNIGLLDRMEISLALPVVLYQDGSGPERPAGSSGGAGDVRLGLKVLLAEASALDLSFSTDISFPSGDPEAYRGDGFVTASPALVVGHTGETVRAAAVVGWTLREAARADNLEVGAQVFARAGLGLALVPGSLELFGEVFGLTSATADDGDGVLDETPLEGLVALRQRVFSDLFLTLGAAGGLVGGYGTPLFRLLAGVGWLPAEPDRDGDGLSDRDDGCPEQAEDRDGYEDGDGCPDPDDDGDGVPDGEDRCPDAVEDRDGFEDGDGCPEPDNDGDLLPDFEDRCPDEAEDDDGYEDDDGCPDPDDDDDGVPDPDDRCPRVAEDRDGFEDGDGCPDLDDDGDGLADPEDACPREAEDRDGFEDGDGCPDPDPSAATLVGDRIVTPRPVDFEPGGHALAARAEPVLDGVARVIALHPEVVRVRVEVHTTASGLPDQDLARSRRRAAAVMRYLVERGVDPTLLVARGLGSDRLVGTDGTPAGRRPDDRVELLVERRSAEDAEE